MSCLARIAARSFSFSQVEARAEGVALEQGMALRQALEDLDHGRDDARADLDERLDQRLGLQDGAGIGLDQQVLVGEARASGACRRSGSRRSSHWRCSCSGSKAWTRPASLLLASSLATARRASMMLSFDSRIERGRRACRRGRARRRPRRSRARRAPPGHGLRAPPHRPGPRPRSPSSRPRTETACCPSAAPR